MKILCVGRKGNSRSVALAYLLKQRGHDAIAVGMRCMGRDTRKMMLDWAELIVLLHDKCIEGILPEYHYKLKRLNLGNCDEYFQGFHHDLILLLEAFIKYEKL